MDSATLTPAWGRMPADIRAILRKRYWDNPAARKKLLKDRQTYPITISLHPPSDQQALQHPEHYRQFIAAWKHEADAPVRWQTRQLRHFGRQEQPAALCINNLARLIPLLGGEAQQQYRHWQTILRQLLAILPPQKTLFDALIDHLPTLEQHAPAEREQLARLILQLHPGMGQGNYLRALPLANTDSKYLETHQSLIEALLESLYPGQVRARGLYNWLNCREKPGDWLLVRPLCARTRRALGGLPLLRLPASILHEHPLPATRLLVLENEQSSLALPELPDTIAVAGGGHNIGWLGAAWMQGKVVAYWGDIDADGLTILARARANCPHLRALMMDEATLQHGRRYLVADHGKPLPEPEHLTEAEKILWQRLACGHYGANRLEQERIATGYIQAQLNAWLAEVDAMIKKSR